MIMLGVARCRRISILARYGYMLPVLILAGLMLVSCRLDNKISGPSGAPAVLYLQVESDSPKGIPTKVDESAISNIHILIYNSSGELIGQTYSTSSTVSVDTRSATGCTVYAIANTGNPALFSGYDIHSENTLKAMTRTISSWDELTEGSTLPMSGSVSGVNITSGSNVLSGGLKVSRMTGKVTINVGISSGSGITITGYRICGLPKKAYYVARPLATEANEADTQTTRGSDASLPSTATDWTNSGPLSPTTTTTITKTFYMYENRAGVNTGITSQSNKIKENVPGTPADSAAYIIINGTAPGYTYLIWRVYLGANNTSNFNIKRNCNYTYNITLKPTTADTRVTYKRSYAVWAGSNIYWDGSKLTFDETPSGNSDLKQGVHFKWGSLIGMPPAGSGVPTQFYVPTYNSAVPANSTWAYTAYTYSSIYCFDGETLTSTNDRNNTFLNDAARNTDAYYSAYKGDICKYLSKTGAVSGNWRMPKSIEFGEAAQYTSTGSYGSQTTTSIAGTDIINSYKTLTVGGIPTRFPASGYRYTNGSLYVVGQYGYYWSSSAYSGASYSYGLNFNSGNVFPAYYSLRQNGFSVRCVQE